VQSNKRFVLAVRAAALLLVAFPLSGAWCRAAFADEAALTLADAQRLAIHRSQSLAAQDFAATAYHEMAASAGQLPDPVATVGVNNVPVSGADAWSLTRDFMTMTSVGVMQEFTTADKRAARSERYEREADKAAAEREARTSMVLRDSALAWLDRYYIEAMQAAVRELVAAMGGEVEAAEASYRAGKGTLSDVLAGRASLAGLEDRASELGRRARTARIALARWIGSAANARLAEKPDTNVLRLDPRVLDTELEHHPQVAVYARQEAVAEAEVRLAQANKKPDWSVALMYNVRGPAYANMVSVNLSIPLQWDQRGRQDREVAAKFALLDQARAEREDAMRLHTAETQAMLGEWENDRERVGRYGNELVPLAAQRAEATLTAYRNGRAGLPEVLAARRAEMDVRLQALQLEMDTARLWAQLAFLAVDDETHPVTELERARP